MFFLHFCYHVLFLLSEKVMIPYFCHISVLSFSLSSVCMCLSAWNGHIFYGFFPCSATACKPVLIRGHIGQCLCSFVCSDPANSSLFQSRDNSRLRVWQQRHALVTACALYVRKKHLRAVPQSAEWICSSLVSEILSVWKNIYSLLAFLCVSVLKMIWVLNIKANSQFFCWASKWASQPIWDAR